MLKVMRTVGASTEMGGSGRGSEISAMVSPIPTFRDAGHRYDVAGAHFILLDALQVAVNVNLIDLARRDIALMVDAYYRLAIAQLTAAQTTNGDFPYIVAVVQGSYQQAGWGVRFDLGWWQMLQNRIKQRAQIG